VEYLFRANSDEGNIVNMRPNWRLYAGFMNDSGTAAGVAFGTDTWPTPVTNFLTASTTPNFDSGHWYYVAVTYSNDGSTVTFDVYTADLDQGQTELSHTVQSATRTGGSTSESPLGIGMQGFPENDKGFFQGNVDEVAFYESVLSQSALQRSLAALMNDFPRKVLVAGSRNDRVWQFDLNGTFEGVFASGFSPGGIAQDSDGNVYIADTDNHGGGDGGGPVRKYTDRGQAMANAFNGAANVRPDDLAFDNDGTLYFVNPFGAGGEDDQVYRVDDVNTATVVVPTSFNDPDNLTGTDTLDTPRGLDFDDDGNLIVTDRNNARILKFDPDTGNLLGVIISGESNAQGPNFVSGNI
jgi:hypothetical protein